MKIPIIISCVVATTCTCSASGEFDVSLARRNTLSNKPKQPQQLQLPPRDEQEQQQQQQDDEQQNGGTGRLPSFTNRSPLPNQIRQFYTNNLMNPILKSIPTIRRRTESDEFTSDDPYFQRATKLSIPNLNNLPQQVQRQWKQLNDSKPSQFIKQNRSSMLSSLSPSMKEELSSTFSTFNSKANDIQWDKIHNNESDNNSSHSVNLWPLVFQRRRPDIKLPQLRLLSRLSERSSSTSSSKNKKKKNGNHIHTLALFDKRGGSISAAPASTSTSATTTPKKRRRNNSGFYYGIREDIFLAPYEKDDNVNEEEERGQKREIPTSPNSNKPKPKPRNNNDDIPTPTDITSIMGETLLELREMREDIIALREEMQYMQEELKRSISSRPSQGMVDGDDVGGGREEEEEEEDTGGGVTNTYVSRMKRQREFDKIGAEVEEWASRLLFEEKGEEDGWKEVKCNKAVRKKFNPDENTQCFIKFMKDPRGKYARPEDEDREFPCLKCYTTMDAPFEHVCKYLSQEENIREYNSLVIANRDLEEISPYSKICWSQCPQVLFIKSRDFVTFCHHRWRRDGTQIVVSQACEHEDEPGCDSDTDGKICRAQSLRGANFISRDPNDPSKTRFALVTHADAGGNLAPWALKTAVNALAPIEPFKLFSKIEKQVQARKDIFERQIDMVQSPRSRPSGLSQMGYACFWPDGADTKTEKRTPVLNE